MPVLSDRPGFASPEKMIRINGLPHQIHNPAPPDNSKSDAQKFRPNAIAFIPAIGFHVGALALGFNLRCLETCICGSGLKSEVNVPWLKSLTSNLASNQTHSNTFFAVPARRKIRHQRVSPPARAGCRRDRRRLMKPSTPRRRTKHSPHRPARRPIRERHVHGHQEVTVAQG